MAKITYRYDRTVHKIPKELRTLHLGTAAVPFIPSKPRKARITYNGVPQLPLRRWLVMSWCFSAAYVGNQRAKNPVR